MQKWSEIEKAGSIAVHTYRLKQRCDVSVLSAGIAEGSEATVLGGESLAVVSAAAPCRHLYTFPSISRSRKPWPHQFIVSGNKDKNFEGVARSVDARA